MDFRFQNRAEAGRLLADKLQAYAGRTDVVVLGLPRGGIPVAFEAAKNLRSPLHAFLVRKLGVPGQEELAMGAIASGGVCFLNQPVIESLFIRWNMIDRVIEREKQELKRQEDAFCAGRLPVLLERVVILIDDGLATGASMRAAVITVRQHQPKWIIVAAPVAPQGVCRSFETEAHEVVCLQTPRRFEGVGQWYEDFSQTTDAEVRELLEQGWKFQPVTPEPKLLQGSNE